MLVGMPHEFNLKIATEMGVTLPPKGEYGVGMMFIDKDPTIKAMQRKLIERAAKVRFLRGHAFL